MATPTSAKPTKTFTFTVGPDGKFTYDPTDDWIYFHTDTIRFQTESGPFTMGFLLETPVPVARFSPLRGPLKSVQEGSSYHADTTVKDNLTQTDREMLMELNKGPQHPDGFVGRYRYDIKVTVGGKNLRG